MAVFSEPTKWQTSLVNSGDANTIPQNTPVGTGKASFDDGFPQITQVPIGAGGIAPDRKDFNGLFKILGDWIFFAQNGGLPTYSASFDYVVGRYVVYNNTLYKCIQANGASSTVVAPDSVSPLGSDYWKDIENQDTTSLIPNQIIQSPVPLTDANLHLLDGALLSGSGAYADYVTMMSKLHDADPTLACFTDEATWQSTVSTYGVCGKFVWDSVNETLRLPKITGFIEGTNTASELGSLTEAGLPNIKASLSFCDNNATNLLVRIASASGAFSGESTSAGTLSTAGDYTSLNVPHIANFNANYSNAIYKDGFNKVQPQSIKQYFYIVVGTVSKTQIQIDIDNVMADLALKADTDFSNINNTAKIAIAHNAMPSDKYDDLTLGASGTTYTAPADGYVLFTRTATAVGDYVTVVSTVGIDSSSSTTNPYGLRVFLPVRKGDSFSVDYYGGNNQTLRFIYAVGSESEKA